MCEGRSNTIYGAYICAHVILFVVCPAFKLLVLQIFQSHICVFCAFLNSVFIINVYQYAKKNQSMNHDWLDLFFPWQLDDFFLDESIFPEMNMWCCM